MRVGNIQPPLGTPINANHPLSKGMIGCWLLNEGGGKIATNSTGYGIMNGSLSANVVYTNTTRGIAANVSGAATGDAILCGSSLPTQLSTPISLSIWFNTLSTSTDCYLFGRADYQTDLFGFEFFMLSGKLYWYIDGSAGTSTLNTTSVGTTWNDGKWHMATAVADGTNQFIYVDGRLIISGAQSQTPSYSTLYNMYIGNSWDSAHAAAFHPFGGYLNTAMMWNRALQATEVGQLFTNSYQMFADYNGTFYRWFDLQRHYKLNNSGIRPRPFAPGLAR